MESQILMSFKRSKLCTSFTSNLHGVCGMVWYRTSSYAHRSPQTYMACVAWCGIGHQAMHIVHLKPTWRVWHGVVQDIKLCTSFTSNLHGVCGMVWYRTSSYAHRSPQTYMACVAWCGIGHQAMHIVHLKPTWCVWHGVV